MIEFIRSLIENNFPLLYFPHGLFFFAVGIGILVQHRKKYAFRFAKDFWIMGVFALIHAFSEWFDVFIPLQAPYFNSETIDTLILISQVIEAISYMILFIFGFQLLASDRFSKLVWIPVGIFLVWCTIAGGLLLQKTEPVVAITFIEQLSHYILLFPSCIVTAVALYKQGKANGELLLPPKVLFSIKALAWVFVCVGIFNGLIVDPGTFFPANIINSEIFSNITQVQIIRGLIGTALMCVILKLLYEFNKETDRILTKAEEDAYRFSERDRIGQDLHDGVIQTLYATGMMLEATTRKLELNSPIREQLNVCIKGLNASLLDLRHYITGLKDENISREPLYNLFKKLLMEIQETYEIQAEFEFNGNELLRLTPNCQNHLYYVLTELLNNIGKHTSSDCIHLRIEEEANEIIIKLWDNGKERPPEDFWNNKLSIKGPHMGLRNIRERLMILGGEIRYSFPPVGGNLVTLRMPKEESLENADSIAVSR